MFTTSLRSESPGFRAVRFTVPWARRLEKQIVEYNRRKGGTRDGSNLRIWVEEQMVKCENEGWASIVKYTRKLLPRGKTSNKGPGAEEDGGRVCAPV